MDSLKKMCPVCYDTKLLESVPCKTHTKCCKECWERILKNNEQLYHDNCPICSKCAYRMRPVTFFS